MGKKDFNNISISDTETDFNFNEVAHSENEKRIYNTKTPKRENYCIRLQKEIYNEFFRIIELKYSPSDRAHKRSEILEELMINFINIEKK